MLSKISLNELEAPMLENESVPELLEEWNTKKKKADVSTRFFADLYFPSMATTIIGCAIGSQTGDAIEFFGGGLIGASPFLLSSIYFLKKVPDFQKVDKKIPYSIKLFPRVVLSENMPSEDEDSWEWWSKQTKICRQKKNLAEKDYLESAKLINAVRNWYTNWDLYSETGKDKYKNFAKNESLYLKNICRRKFGAGFIEDVSNIETELLEFFPYEAELWSSVQSGTAPSDSDIRKYVDMRGADGKYHAKIIEGFTGKDFSKPLCTWMRLADTSNDWPQLASDIEAGLPNVAVMYTAQKMRPEKITAQEVRGLGYADAKISSLKDSLMAGVSGFDYGKSWFLKEELQELYHPTPEYVSIR